MPAPGRTCTFQNSFPGKDSSTDIPGQFQRPESSTTRGLEQEPSHRPVVSAAQGLYRGQQRPDRGANDSYHSHGSGKAHLAPARRLPVDSEGRLYVNRSTHGSSRRSERSDRRLLGNKCVLSRGDCRRPSFKDRTGHKFSSCVSFRYSELSHLWSRERGRELRSQGHPKRGLD